MFLLLFLLFVRSMFSFDFFVHGWYACHFFFFTATFQGSIVSFVSCHLAAHSKHLLRRHSDVVDVLKHARVGNHRLDITAQSNHVIWLGDLNFRIDLTDSTDGKATNHMEHDVHYKKVAAMIDDWEWDKLYQHDQLQRGMG